MKRKGTYLLLFLLKLEISFKTKGEKFFNLPAGFYIYVSSAFGGGGIEARIKRHLRREKKLHW